MLFYQAITVVLDYLNLILIIWTIQRPQFIMNFIIIYKMADLL